MTRNQRISHWEKIISAIVADYRRLDDACNAAMKAGAMDANGPLFEAIWKSFEGMLGRVDVDGWMTWFIYDNHCGEAGMKASSAAGRKLRAIHTPHNLARIIVETEEQLPSL